MSYKLEILHRSSYFWCFTCVKHQKYKPHFFQNGDKGIVKKLHHPGRGKGYQPISQNMIFYLLKSFINKESKYICNKNNIWFWCAHIQGLYYRIIKIWHYLSRGRRVRQKNAGKTLCANCCKGNIFNLFNNPPKN